MVKCDELSGNQIWCELLVWDREAQCAVPPHASWIQVLCVVSKLAGGDRSGLDPDFDVGFWIGPCSVGIQICLFWTQFLLSPIQNTIIEL